jgi:hypothetical protein
MIEMSSESSSTDQFKGDKSWKGLNIGQSLELLLGDVNRDQARKYHFKHSHSKGTKIFHHFRDLSKSTLRAILEKTKIAKKFFFLFLSFFWGGEYVPISMLCNKFKLQTAISPGILVLILLNHSLKIFQQTNDVWGCTHFPDKLYLSMFRNNHVYANNRVLSKLLTSTSSFVKVVG